jgi:cobalt-zinc-cadmium resistance protein CzcA
MERRSKGTLLASFPDEIEHIWTRTGTAEVATDPMGVELSDIYVQLTDTGRWKHARTQDELVERMEARLATCPGCGSCSRSRSR